VEASAVGDDAVPYDRRTHVAIYPGILAVSNSKPIQYSILCLIADESHHEIGLVSVDDRVLGPRGAYNGDVFPVEQDTLHVCAGIDLAGIPIQNVGIVDTRLYRGEVRSAPLVYDPCGMGKCGTGSNCQDTEENGE
jgi:hypothetical protein